MGVHSLVVKVWNLHSLCHTPRILPLCAWKPLSFLQLVQDMRPSLFFTEDFYTTLRVGAISCLLPQNLLQQEGKPATSFRPTPAKLLHPGCSLRVHSTRGGSRGNLLLQSLIARQTGFAGCSSLIPALRSSFFLGFCQPPSNPFGKSF